MANANVTMNTTVFEVEKDKVEDFKKNLEGFYGVELDQKNKKYYLYHWGDGFLFDIDNIHEDEIYNYCEENNIGNLVDFIQFHMTDDKEVIFKEVGNIKARDIWGYAAKITKNNIRETNLDIY